MSRKRQHHRQQPNRAQQQQQQQPQRPPVVPFPYERMTTAGALALSTDATQQQQRQLADAGRSSLNALDASGMGKVQSWQGWPPDAQAPGKPIPLMHQPDADKPDLDIIGASGTSNFSGLITSDEYNPDLLTWIDRVAIYDQMRRNHAPVQAMLRILSLPILRASRLVEPASDDPHDVEIASFVETCLLRDMCYESTEGVRVYQTFDDILRHILLMYAFGSIAFEQCYRIEDGWVKWAKWTPLLPRTIWRWWVGADNELAGIQQWTFKNWNYEYVNIPAGKLLVFTYNREGSNFEGISVLRGAYKHWYLAQQFEKIEAIALERMAVVPPVIKLPEPITAAMVSAAQTIAQNIRVNEQMGVTIPMDWDFEFPKNQAHYAANVQPSLTYHNTMILMAALCDWLQLGNSGTGSYSLADVKLKAYEESLQGDCRQIEDLINQQAIRPLVDYNFDNVAVYPTFKFGKVAVTDVAQLAQGLQQLAQGGLIHPTPELEDAILEDLRLPKGNPSQIAATNPTSPTTPQRPENARSGDHSDEESDLTASNPAAQQAASSGGAEIGTQAAETGVGVIAEEARLLREALDEARQIDVVERGLLFYGHQPGYTRNRNANGTWGPGGGSGASKTKGEGEPKSKAPRAKQEVDPELRDLQMLRSSYVRQMGKLAKSMEAEKQNLARMRRDDPLRVVHEQHLQRMQMQHERYAFQRQAVEEDLARYRTAHGTAKSTEPAESIHERSARLQREQGLAAEVRPGERLTAVGRVPGTHIDVHADLDPRFERAVYGEQQLGAALHERSMEQLRIGARTVGMTGPLPRTKAEMVSAITAHVTEGRYSANFGGGTHGGGASKAKGEGEATKGARGTRVAKSEEERAAGKTAAGGKSAREAELERQLAAVRAENEALKVGKADSKTGEAGARKASGRGVRGKAATTDFESLKPIGPVDLRALRPNGPMDPYALHQGYGRAQTERVLRNQTMGDLRRSTAIVVERNPGTKPASRSKKSDMIDYIMAHLPAEPA